MGRNPAISLASSKAPTCTIRTALAIDYANATTNGRFCGLAAVGGSVAPTSAIGSTDYRFSTLLHCHKVEVVMAAPMEATSTQAGLSSRLVSDRSPR